MAKETPSLGCSPAPGYNLTAKAVKEKTPKGGDNVERKRLKFSATKLGFRSTGSVARSRATSGGGFWLRRFEMHTSRRLTQATNGSGFWQTRGSADWERRLAAPKPGYIRRRFLAASF